MKRKNFLFFSKWEKRGALVLICLILVTLLINRVFPYYFRKKPANISAYKSDIENFQTSLEQKKSTYVPIKNDSKKSTFPKEKKRTGAVVEKKERDFVVIELNSSDTTELKKLKGIGSVYAQRIVKYRDYLGGFYRAEQLKEVYGFSEELFQSLKPHLTVDTSLIKKIRLNHEDLNTRLRHPYLKKEQISALISFRKKNKNFGSFEDLKEQIGLPEEDWERLIPYFSLE